MGVPKIVSYGGGTNLTALLVGLTERNIKVDLILFADTGGERPETYRYVRMFSDWLVEHGQPSITWVRKVEAAKKALAWIKDNKGV